MNAEELLINAMTNVPYIAAMIVDKQGYVVFVNKTYLKMLKRTEKQMIGKHISEITPNSRTLEVLKTGKAIIGYYWPVNDYEGVASSIPLFKGDELVGCLAYSIFLDIWDGKTLMENLVNELNVYKREVTSLYAAKYDFDSLVGESPAMEAVKKLGRQVASRPDTTVLITGESGTGKELMAHSIHSASSRARFPFVKVNCAAIPENLLESELFGYSDGAYTGAKKGGKSGKFEVAHGGSIFLDEVGDMSLGMQAKLLVVLQEKEIERLGDNRPIRVNVRVIAATNRNLEEMVEEGRFREDLYYRLNVVRIHMPALRHRSSDIPQLVEHLMRKLNKKLKTSVTSISAAAMGRITEYNWPGNVRELENVLERALILADMSGADAITPECLVLMNDKANPGAVSFGKGLKTLTEEFERKVIARVLEETGYNKIEAANRLDIDASSLYRKIKRYGLAMDKGAGL